jgi:YbbR domain-containing protein
MRVMRMKRSLTDRAKHLVRDAFTSNLRLKGLAMVITAFVFVIVRGGTEATARLTVDVEVIPPSPTSDRVLMTEVPESVKLRVRGSPRVVQLATEEDIPPLTLDLRTEDDGLYVLDHARFNVPPGLEIVAVDPATIGLRYEKRVRQELEIVAVITGQVASGNHIKEPVLIEPSKVSLNGPISAVRERRDVQTEAISVDGLARGQHVRRVLLEQMPPSCSLGSESVTVTLIVEPDLVERTLANIEIEVRGATLPASAERVTVVVRGLPEQVEQVRPADVHAFVDLGTDGATPGSYRRDVQLSGLESAIQARVVPSSVIVEVQRAAPAPPAPPIDPRHRPGPGGSPNR